jgi:secreted trypsin-like serine protease
MGLNDASYFSKTAYSYVETIAQQMLIAAYEGTLLAAVRYGEQISELKRERQQVFLTLMGCGVFNNKLEWVAQAIEHCMDTIVDHSLDVTLVVFDAASHADMPEFLAAMRAHVDATAGTYTDIR